MMAGTTSHFTLNTGAKIPAVGFGTWKAGPGEAGRSVELAFESGYRHFDCAPLYGNEKEIGEVFRGSKVPRDQYFITTKLWSSDHTRVAAALEKSLSDLQLSYVDLYLMHWPISLDPNTGAEHGKEDRIHSHLAGWDFRDTWKEMEKLLEGNKVKAIGIANFSSRNLNTLLETAKVVPAVNQTELHPFLPQDELHRLCKEKGIHQTAFGPLGGSGSTLHDEPIVTNIAEKRNVTPANVLLSWGIQKGWSVIPKSTNAGRIRNNLEGVFSLCDEEMNQLNSLARSKGRRFNRPNWGTVVFHDDEGLNLE
ncbi:glycerol dehydrogenase Gcy1 [Leptodontidium sp. MPI-SDFR-AT-0119]|nr:glycerol dehydrogenase Gcy1 [Leptodontidium sp. MPI-SDFR-AT-0119]